MNLLATGTFSITCFHLVCPWLITEQLTAVQCHVRTAEHRLQPALRFKSGLRHSEIKILSNSKCKRRIQGEWRKRDTETWGEQTLFWNSAPGGFLHTELAQTFSAHRSAISLTRSKRTSARIRNRVLFCGHTCKQRLRISLLIFTLWGKS